MHDTAKRKIRKKKTLAELPSDSLPREKLIALGRENITDSDVLAILLGTGSAKQNVLTLSEKLLKQFPLKTLAQSSLTELIRFGGIGPSKATRILAALELGERVFAPESFTKTILRSREDTLNQLRDIAQKKQEYLVVLYLNARYELIQKEVVGVGSLNSMVITPKEIFSHALLTPCASIIIAHNHPSGDPTPSDDDIRFTTTIQEAGEIMHIPLLDHVIIGSTGYFSFRDNLTRNK